MKNVMNTLQSKTDAFKDTYARATHAVHTQPLPELTHNARRHTDQFIEDHAGAIFLGIGVGIASAVGI